MGLLLPLGACTSTSLPEQSTASTADQLGFSEDDGDEPFRLAMVRPEGVDPATINLAHQGEVILTDLLYDGLVESTPGHVQLTPALATDWTHQNHVRWIFDLDTERITAAQVKASFERLLQKQPDSVAATALQGVIGANSLRSGEAGHAAGIVASAPGRVVFELSQPQAGFAWLLSGVPFSVVGDNGALTGRYDEVTETDQGVTLQSSQSTPGVEILWYQTPDAAYQELTLGMVDAALVDWTLIEGASSRFGSGGTARNVMRFVGLNELAPDLVSPDIRMAVISSIDRSQATIGWERPFFPANGVVAPSIRGFRVGGCGATCHFDPNLGQRLLAEAGAAPDLTLTYVSDRDAMVAAAIGENLQTAGFAVNVQQLPARALADSIADGSAELFLTGWVSPAGTVDAVIPFLFGSQSELNVTRTSNEAVDELLAAASKLSDDGLRWALLAQAEQAALADAVIAPLSVERNVLVSSPDARSHSIRADGSISFDR